MKRALLFCIAMFMLVLTIQGATALINTSGNITTDGDFTVVTFLSNGTFNTTEKLVNVSILVVGGGGGGGGSYYAGGGGGGGLKFNNSINLSANNYNITVGYGGVGGSNSNNGTNGGNSSVSGIVKAGGGGGGASSVLGAGSNGVNGSNGGGSSGGGGPPIGGYSTDGGFPGGNNVAGGNGAGGGGGCGGPGLNATAASGGYGGSGVNKTSYFPTLSNVQICGGGGGACGLTTANCNGIGVYGGGNGSVQGTPADATNGINGTGGGGGGTERSGTKKGGDGGSGFVIIRYLTNQPSTNTLYIFNTIELFNISNLSNVNISTANGSCLTVGGTCTLSTNFTYGTLNFNASKAGFFTVYGSLPPNSTATINMTQGYINITNLTAIITGTTINPNNGTWFINTSGGRTYYGNSTNYPSYIYLVNGSNTVSLSYNGSWSWYNTTISINISAPQNKTVIVTDIYDSLLNVTAKAVMTNTSVNSFSLNVSNSTYAYYRNYSTTTGYVLIPAKRDTDIFLLLDEENYSYANTTKSILNSSPYYQFLLYTNNSILINIYSEDTGFLLSGTNVTVITSGTGNYSISNYTTTGTLFIDNLPDDTYNIKFTSENYTLRTYTVTVTARSTQTLNAYMTAATNTVIFTTRDALTGLTVEDVSITQYRVINSTLTPIETKATDITGRAQLVYTYGYKYTFQVSKTGYDSKVFSLDPILFSSYDISLDRSIVEQSSYSDVYIDFTPNYFSNNQTTNFSFLFNSANGVLSSYNLSVVYPGGTYNGTGSLANGQTFQTVLNITGATLTSTVLVNFTYSTVFGEVKSATYVFLVAGGVASGQLANIRNNTYGMGVFERILLATLIVIFGAGIASIFAGRFIGLIIGLVCLLFLGMIGFVPWAYTYITILMGILLAYKIGGSEDG